MYFMFELYYAIIILSTAAIYTGIYLPYGKNSVIGEVMNRGASSQGHLTLKVGTDRPVYQ